MMNDDNMTTLVLTAVLHTVTPCSVTPVFLLLGCPSYHSRALYFPHPCPIRLILQTLLFISSLLSHQPAELPFDSTLELGIRIYQSIQVQLSGRSEVPVLTFSLLLNAIHTTKVRVVVPVANGRYSHQ